MQDHLSRRTLLKSAALAAAPAVVPALGANDKLNVAWIGTGTRGNYLMQRFFAGPATRTKPKSSPCATPTKAISPGPRTSSRPMAASTPKTYDDYQDLLKDPSIDAVVIATPEHLHYPMFMAAIKAGKNIYVEKPLAHTIEQGAEMVKAWQKSGKVVQVGTQNRSNYAVSEGQGDGRQGMIGDIHYVRAFWYRNSLDNDPAWRYAIPADASPDNTDWERSSKAPRRSGLRQAALLSMAALLGLLGRHLHRPAGPPDRHHELRLRQDRPDLLHGLGRHLSLDRTTIAMCPIRFSAIYEYPGQVPHQLQLATSATITTATARTSWATKAPSKC